MSGLDKIAVKVVGPDELPTGNVSALLHELAGLLDTWVRTGEAASVDLRSLPLTKGDYAELRAALGTGAVAAHIEAMGASEVRETRYPGVWWVTHCNDMGEVVAELIEVCEAPALLRAPREDAEDGLARFKEALRS